MLNTCVPALELLNVVPGRLTLWIATLSLTTAVNVTVCVCELVANVTLVSSAPKLLIDGFWSSLLVILIVTVSVTLFPAVSLTVNVNVSLDEPKL